MRISSTRLLLAVSVLCFTLFGCGKHSEKTDAGQVAAVVNGSEISIHQINQALEDTPGLTAENVDMVRKEVLEKLIVQNLAEKKAIETKLDRTPEVIMALDATRRDTLAQAYLTHVAEASAKVTDADIKGYFDDHPELFTQRRLYLLTEISFASDDNINSQLQYLLAKNKPVKDIKQWLTDHGMTYKEDNVSRAAEQLSFVVLKKLASLKDGQSDIFDDGTTTHVIYIVSSQPEPVKLDVASSQIARFLDTQRKQKLMSDELKRLRDAASVEYMGDFAKNKSQ